MSNKINVDSAPISLPGLKNIAICLLGSLALALSAQVTMPGLIPGTMQTFAVFFLAALLPYQLAVPTFMLYLFEGAMGFPVFAEAGFGLAVLVGPRGGYLIGMLIATAVVSYLSKKIDRNHSLKVASVLILGSTILFASGLLGLARFVPQEQLLAVGLYPFVLSELLKISLVIMSLRLMQSIKRIKFK